MNLHLFSTPGREGIGDILNASHPYLAGKEDPVVAYLPAGSLHFRGLNLTPFNFSCRYPEDEVSRLRRDEWLSDYHVFHDNPVVMLADGAYVQVEGKKTRLVRGDAWILRKGQDKQKLETGKQIFIEEKEK